MALDLKNIKGKKLSKKNLNLILAVAGVFILIASYFLGYSSLTEKKDAMEKTLEERSTYLGHLKEYYASLGKYEEGTNNAKSEIGRILDRLPVGFKDEDFLIWLIRADEKIGSKTSSVSFSSVESVNQFNTFVDGGFKDVVGYRAAATASMKLNYKQFKNYLDYIYADDTKYTFVDSVSLSYNAEDATLNAVFNLSKFYIDYENSTYKGEEGFDVSIGKDNPFGTN